MASDEPVAGVDSAIRSFSPTSRHPSAHRHFLVASGAGLVGSYDFGCTDYWLVDPEPDETLSKQALSPPGASPIAAHRTEPDNQLVAIFETLKQTANIAYPNQHFSSLGIAKFIAFLQDSCNIAVFDDLPDDLGPALYSSQSTEQKVLRLKVCLFIHISEPTRPY